MTSKYKMLVSEIRNCNVCKNQLAYGPRPIFQISPNARILIAGQAPGLTVHETGLPFDDPSGERLRSWMGISRALFYDANKIAILPMGFCYPGKGKSGDLPPRKECPPLWRQPALNTMPHIQLTLLIGRYAQDWHLGETKKSNVTETVRAWRSYLPGVIPLPHPSPRNNIWLSKNTWFEMEVINALQKSVKQALR